MAEDLSEVRDKAEVDRINKEESAKQEAERGPSPFERAI